jgi:hypothetical protein
MYTILVLYVRVKNIPVSSKRPLIYDRSLKRFKASLMRPFNFIKIV